MSIPEPPSRHFLCVSCGMLTDECICDHGSTGVFTETERAFRQKAFEKLASIETKLDRLLEIVKQPRTVVIQGFDDE